MVERLVVHPRSLAFASFLATLVGLSFGCHKLILQIFDLGLQLLLHGLKIVDVRGLLFVHVLKLLAISLGLLHELELD